MFHFKQLKKYIIGLGAAKFMGISDDLQISGACSSGVS